MIHVIVLGLVVAAFVLGYLIGTRTMDARADQLCHCEVPDIKGTIVRLCPEYSPLTALMSQMEKVEAGTGVEPANPRS